MFNINMVKKLICTILGHKNYVLKIGHGRSKIVTGPERRIQLTSTPMYWHWRCDRCGLTSCNRRFKRYT